MTTPAAAALTLAGALALGAVSPGAAQPLPQPTARVSGTVVDETGGAMRGVFVRLLPEAGSLTAGFVQLQAEPVVDTTTDAGGAFTFEAPLGAYRLRVSAPGFRTVDRPLRVTPDLEPLAVTLALEALRENIDVVDAGDGSGITGAPATFTQTSGNGELDIAEAAVESFIQADRGFGERASLRLGLRYEATNHSVDYLRMKPDRQRPVPAVRRHHRQRRLAGELPGLPRLRPPHPQRRVAVPEAVDHLGPVVPGPVRGRPHHRRRDRSGRDLNGDQSSRDRPPGVPRNSETGPGRVDLDMTFTKEVRAPATDRLVRFQARLYNLLNTSRIRGYSGVLSSPLFGRPTGYLRGRTVRLSMEVDF